MTKEMEAEILEHLLKSARGIKSPKVEDHLHLSLGYRMIREKMLKVGRRNRELMLGVNRVEMTMELFRIAANTGMIPTNRKIERVIVYYSLPLSNPECMDARHMAKAVRIHDQTLDAPTMSQYDVHRNHRGVK